jgi:predicted signal transduction protein with EAL and GGDEF domain
MLQLRIAPAQLRRLDSLAGVVAALCEAGGGTAPCLLLPEAAVHRDAYLVIDAATAVAALGATLGIDDYRGLLPPPELARAGIGALRVHRSLVRELGERPFAADRLADLLARARASGLSVLVPSLADRVMVSAAAAAGALHLSGPVFGRPQRLSPVSPSSFGSPSPTRPPAQESPDGQGPVRTDRRPGAR